MSKYDDGEVLNAGVLGTYRVHSLFTRISSDGDMEPESGEPFKFAVALHAHEYTHFLHNLTTCAGVDSLLACFWLMVPFVNNTDERGWFTAPEGIDQDENLQIAFKVMNTARGTVEGIPKCPQFNWPKVDEWSFGEPCAESVKLSHADHGDIGEIPVCSVRVTAKSKGREPIELILRPGLDFISEGIAYEVEREQCRLAGIEEKNLDSQTPSYPYLAYRSLINYFVGRETTAFERIAIGNSALMTFAPSATLFKLCTVLKQDSERGDGNTTCFDNAISHIARAFMDIRAKPELSPVVQMKEIMAGSEDLRKGIEIYGALIEKGLNLRARRPMLELSFIQKALSPVDFRTETINLLERLVCQEKVQPPHKIEWIGAPGSIAELSDEELQRLSMLQTSIHYLQQHFTIDGRLGNTADLRDSACPFDGACPVQADYADFEVCSTKPWRVSVGGGENKVCWYEAGRLSLRLDRRAIPDQPSPTN